MRIAFCGTPDFAVPCLNRLLADGHEIAGVLTQPDKPQGRKMKLTPPPVKALALEHERRGRSSKGRPRKLSKEVEEDLLAEVQRLRAENEYLKNLQALVLEQERRQHKKRW